MSLTRASPLNLPSNLLTHNFSPLTPHVGEKIISLTPNTPPHRILMVDDEDNNRLPLKNHSNSLGFPLQQASNGGNPALFSRILACQNGMVVKLAVSSVNKTSVEERETIPAAGCDNTIGKPSLGEILFSNSNHLFP